MYSNKFGDHSNGGIVDSEIMEVIPLYNSGVVTIVLVMITIITICCHSNSVLP